MKRVWLIGTTAALLSIANVGCVSLDEHQALQRANGTLQEALALAKDDLQGCELANAQKDTTIGSLRNQLAAKDETIANLTDQTQYLQEAFNKAQAILEEQAARGVGQTVVVRPALPLPLHEKLKALADAHPDLIEYDEAKGAVRWKSDLLFPEGSDQLTGSDQVLASLREFAAIVSSEAAAGFDVIVVGHTCTKWRGLPATVAKHPSNWHLSVHRSISVMNMLAAQEVAMTRMGVMGYGEHRPIAENSPNEGNPKNRRVEIYLVPQDAVRSVSQGVRRVADTDLAFLPATAR